MHKLTDRQIKVLRLVRSGMGFREMKTYHISSSTAHDAFKRAQNNLNEAIEIIDLATEEKWLEHEQIRRLKDIVRRL
jgi:hypothetical protein